MATCSNHHSNPNNYIDYGEFGASPVAPYQGRLAGGPTAALSQEQQRSLRCSASTRRLTPMAAGLFFAIVGAVISVATTFAISDLPAPIRGNASTAPPASPSARPDYLSDQAAALIARPAPRGTDVQGFVGYPDARCNSANPAVAMGRTSKSLIVICQNYAGRFYYKGFGLKGGRSVEVDDLELAEDKFTTTSNGALYLVSSTALTITRGSTSVVDEPMLEYWSV
jgi:hypothetical protein